MRIDRADFAEMLNHAANLPEEHANALSEIDSHCESGSGSRRRCQGSAERHCCRCADRRHSK